MTGPQARNEIAAAVRPWIEFLQKVSEAPRADTNSCRTFGAFLKNHNAKTTPLRTWLFHSGPAGLGARPLSSHLSLRLPRFLLLLFNKLFLVPLDPDFQFHRRLFQLIIVQ